MDGYFVTPPAPITLHAPFVPEAIPNGNSYQVSQTFLDNFWSVRDLWLEERWPPQSEVTIASSLAQAWPVYLPYESTMTQVVMMSW